jgi:tellurite resistance protein TehA-like permease
MGTGIIAILLHNLPYNARWVYWISVVLFVVNTCLFVLFTVVSVMRYTMFPGLWKAMVAHPVQSLFLGVSVHSLPSLCGVGGAEGYYTICSQMQALYQWVSPQSST